MCYRYGPAPSNTDSAVNVLLDVVRDQSGKQYTMDHYQTRFPTNVLDIASFLVRLAGKELNFPLPRPPTVHIHNLCPPFIAS
jgi:S-adenosylmethionine synthetase